MGRGVDAPIGDMVAQSRDQRRLAAMLAADMVGYSRFMEADESGTIARRKTHGAERTPNAGRDRPGSRPSGAAQRLTLTENLVEIAADARAAGQSGSRDQFRAMARACFCLARAARCSARWRRYFAWCRSRITFATRRRSSYHSRCTLRR